MRAGAASHASSDAGSWRREMKSEVKRAQEVKVNSNWRRREEELARVQEKCWVPSSDRRGVKSSSFSAVNHEDNSGQSANARKDN